MEIQMKTLTKAVLGAAMLAGSVLAASAPANAQPGYGGDGYSGRYDGYGDYGRQNGGYGDYGREYGGYGRQQYDERYGSDYYRRGGGWRSTSICTSPRFGRWRFEPALQRRVFVPYRWAVRGGHLRNCMYAMNRGGYGGYGGYGGGYR
jgi:hypothetical protein